MTIWETLDQVGSDVLGATGGALADRLGTEIAPSAPKNDARPEAQPDAMVTIPQNGPEQKEATKTVSEKIKDQLGDAMPWAIGGLVLITGIAIWRAS